MAMVLYHGEPNGPSLTVLAALFETGCAAELKAIDLAAGERHAPAVPKSVEVEMSIEGEGPVLVADGEAMADSVFIARFLNDSVKGSPIVPADPYARWEMMTWCRQIIERTAPAAAYLGLERFAATALADMDEPAFAALTARIASDDLKARWIDARAGKFDAAKLADSRAKIAAAAEKVEMQLRDGRAWLFGAFTIADLETYAWLSGMREIARDAFAGKPNSARWFEAMEKRPSVAKALSMSASGAPARAFAPGPEINRWG